MAAWAGNTLVIPVCYGSTYVHLDDIRFEWQRAEDVSDGVLTECSALFSNHYGVWSETAKPPRVPGRQISMSPKTMRRTLCLPNVWLALARHEGRLVGHAFAVRLDIPGLGLLSWVTQLVVHADYENIGIAKNLLVSIFGFSDSYAWGLATANPKAVRALETATRRRVEPSVVCHEVAVLEDVAKSSVPYVASGVVQCGAGRAVVDSRFPLDHSILPRLIAESSTSRGLPWRLGDLGEGEEWMAFTFGHQQEFPLTATGLALLLQHSQDKLKEAFERMTQDENHVWAQFAEAEAAYLVQCLGLQPGARVLDVGCGRGRHALALARLGMKVVGVDNVRSFVERASERARQEGLDPLCRFEVADARTLEVGETGFDAVFGLYDVVGSFADQEENIAILRSMSRHARAGGHVALSVMNMELTEKRAMHKASIASDPGALIRLPASTKMETTGEVFDPMYYLLDPETRIVYRKEQFSVGNQLPAEIIVRDRRYTTGEIEALVRSVGLDVEFSRFVRAGRFGEKRSSDTAKEILVVARNVG
jgi:cyclopropane fatty-acyl-phospholipid synthase-like methyltransferase